MTVLIDTSVWIEFLRGTKTAATRYVRGELGREAATSEPIMLELLAGARPGDHANKIERLLLSQRWLSVNPSLDYQGAVDVFHATRASGHQPRSLQDCLIAAVALRHHVVLVLRDVDFERIADATGLMTTDVRG